MQLATFLTFLTHEESGKSVTILRTHAKEYALTEMNTLAARGESLRGLVTVDSGGLIGSFARTDHVYYTRAHGYGKT